MSTVPEGQGDKPAPAPEVKPEQPAVAVAQGEGGGGGSSFQGKSEAPDLANILEDPRYKQGLALQKEGKYEEALVCLGACMAIV